MPQANHSATKPPRFTLWFGVLAILVLARLATLGLYPLIDPTEGRYAEIPREMVASGDWVVPHLESGTPFWGKPPLQFWAIALSYSVFGITEFTARLPSFVFAVFAGALTFLLATRLRGRMFGLVSTIILATTALFYFYAGAVATDPALLATVTLAMVAFPLAMRAHSLTAKQFWGYLFFAGLGLSVLAKGLVGGVLILVPIGWWVLWKRQWREVFRRLPWIPGFVLTLAIAVPWHLLCEHRSPGFLEYYFVGEHFKRFFIPEWEGDLYGSPHEYIQGTIWGFFVLAALPWTVLLAGALVWLRRQGVRLKAVTNDPWLAYVLLWFLQPLVFFTLSSNIMFTYVLPSLPPFAILTAAALFSVRKRMDTAEPHWSVAPSTIATSVALVPCLLLVAAFTLLPEIGERRSQKELAQRFKELDADHDAELVYTDRMPHSGDFYTQGRAFDIPDESRQKILQEISDQDQDYFAIADNDLDEFPKLGFQTTELVGTFGRFTLRREPDKQDLPYRKEIRN